MGNTLGGGSNSINLPTRGTVPAQPALQTDQGGGTPMNALQILISETDLGLQEWF